MKPSSLRTIVLMGALTIFPLGSAMYTGFGNNGEKPIRHTVKISHMKFIPANLIVKKGDTVVWENKDFFSHDVTDEKKNWGSGPFEQNESWSKVITEHENYFCNLHKVMKGTITIEKQ